MFSCVFLPFLVCMLQVLSISKGNQHSLLFPLSVKAAALSSDIQLQPRQMRRVAARRRSRHCESGNERWQGNVGTAVVCVNSLSARRESKKAQLVSEHQYCSKWALHITATGIDLNCGDGTKTKECLCANFFVVFYWIIWLLLSFEGELVYCS